MEDRWQQRRHLASVIAHGDKLERAREITEKMRVKQLDHEQNERKRMEEVLALYVTKRIKAEEKVVSALACCIIVHVFVE